LAVAALHDLEIEPGFLDLCAFGGRPNALNGRNGSVASYADRDQARAGGLAVQMYRARTALIYATSELGSRQANDISQHPQEWHVLRGFDAAILTVDPKCSLHQFRLLYAPPLPA